MKPYSKTNISFLVSVILLICISCKHIPEGKLVITQVPGNIMLINADSDSLRYLQGATISLLDPERGSAEMLSGDFYSACSPDISWDGRRMVFAAQVKQNEPWQIWEMDIKNHKTHKVYGTSENCMDPVFLPADDIVFSKMISDSTSKIKQALFICNSTGTGLRQITFHPHSNHGNAVLYDGRLLTITRQISPGQGEPAYMVLRPDGTKANLFYRGKPGSSVYSRARENNDGGIYFIESDSADPARRDIVTISYNRPLGSSVNLTAALDGIFAAVCPASSGNAYISYMKPGEKVFSVYEFEEHSKTVGKKVYTSPNGNIVDISLIGIHKRPKKLPSEVDMGVKTGLLLCQDINFTGMGLLTDGTVKAGRIEIIGIDSSMGIVNVSEDGSFYLKVVADVPFRIRTLDDKNRIIHENSAWIWLRPNERSGCIGCHENREMAPDNKVPLAVKSAPVTIPVQISGIREKQVELE